MTHRLAATLLLGLLVLPAQAAPKPASKAKGEIAWKMVKVRHGRFQVPHLTRYRDPKVLRSVNRQIDAIVAEMGCDPTTYEIEIRSALKLASRDIFSVYLSGSYDCHGAYPINEDLRSTTFDLRTGRPVKFEELFRDYNRDKRAILSTIFAKQVAAAEKHPQPEAPDPNDDGSCDKSPWLYALDALEEGSYSFNFAPRGLEVQPEWPHVVQACEERVTVPYEKLRPYAAPGGLLGRMLQK
ncbi:MAG TPA: hypothetical protein VGP73_23055 [Thermoanaerobaculia bacterium]